ncbi:MAG TPA: universal stress protein [Xanthobacteraceae bacterium]|nr:universal stress protein [Xanthobacteraceae bacterium]
MALKDLLVYVDETRGAILRLQLAVDLAIRNGSRLTALYVREWNQAQLDQRKAAELGLVPASEIHRLDERIKASIDSAAERFRPPLEALTREHGLETELRCVDGAASAVVPQHARYADLCILGRDAPHGRESVEYTFSERMLFMTGRPVLLVPASGSFATLGRHIVVAWNSSRPAARSINDALPLIERAERTTILMINPSDFPYRDDGPPGEHIVEHLRRHGAQADAVRIENVPHASIAHQLQAEAHALGADLIVAGAFGHPRMWEKLLGGVTYDLLAHMSLPILMSH